MWLFKPAPCVLLSVLAALDLPCSYARSWNLYASAGDSKVHTLKLTSNTMSHANASYHLTDAGSTEACGKSPSWLTLARKHHTLFCSDEAALPGSLSSIKVKANGSLLPTAKVDTIGGDVHNAVFQARNKSFVAIAHYSNSSISTFELPLTNGSKAVQVLGPFNLTRPGPVKGSQDISHPHQVIVDPTGSFVVSPDLGADLLRVFAIQQSTGMLQTCDPVKVKPGSGPRHALFRQLSAPAAPGPDQLGGPRPPSNRYARFQPFRKNHTIPTSSTVAIYLASELSSEVSFYRVSNNDRGCPSIVEISRQSNFPVGATYNSSAACGEVRARGRYLYVSNRLDASFGPGQDSITSWTITRNGTLEKPVLNRAFGSVPRTFEINRKGNLVAIGNQNSGSVAVAKREMRSGKVLDMVGNLKIAAPGQAGSGGVTSVVWGYEDEMEY